MRTPSSPRVKSRYQDQGHTVSDASIPNIRVHIRDSSQTELHDVIEAAVTLSNPSLQPFGPDTADSLPNDELVESLGFPQPNLGQDVDNEHIDSLPVPRIIEPSGETLMTVYEPIKYTPSALSAGAECNFWDVPCSDTARMVPLPLYISTPPRPCSRLSTDQEHTRFSLLPYADLFDFSMYNSISRDSFPQFSFGDLPPDVTTSSTPGTKADSTLRPSEIAYRNRYRSSAYSKPTGPYFWKPLTTPIKSSSVFSSSDRQQLREISLNSVGFDSPLAERMRDATGIRDSTFSMYSQSSASSVDLCKSAEGRRTRLHSACDDLSRWTDEEFMKLVLE